MFPTLPKILAVKLNSDFISVDLVYFLLIFHSAFNLDALASPGNFV